MKILNTPIFAYLVCLSFLWTSLVMVGQTASVALGDKDTYCNERYGFCLEYSTKIYPLADVGENNDGIVLRSKGGESRLKAFGSHNMLDNSPLEELSFYINAIMDESETDVQVISEVDETSYSEALLQSGEVFYYIKVIRKGSSIIGMGVEVNRARTMTEMNARKALEVIISSLDLTT